MRPMDALSAPMKKFLAGLTAMRHGGAPNYTRTNRLIGDAAEKTFPKARAPSDPDASGHRPIEPFSFVNPVFTVAIKDIPEAGEQERSWSSLYEHCARPHWQVPVSLAAG